MKKYFNIAITFLIIPHILFAQQLTVPKVFGNNMVVQRGINIPVWGKSTVGSKITIEFASTKTLATANAEGKWTARLPILSAGGPYVLKIYSDSDTLKFSDVWLASGQSNMQMAVGWGIDHQEEELKSANYPDIRLFTVGNDLNNKPQDDIPAGSWLPCTPETVKDFSAIGYFFARQIQSEINVPIGIIHSSWGGTDIQPWISADALQTQPLYKDTLPKIITQTGDFSNGYEASEKVNKHRDSIIATSNIGIKTKVFALRYNDDTWKTLLIPTKWKNYGIENYYGYVWFRKHICLKSTSKELTLNLGMVSHDNIAYFNGKELKKTGGSSITSYKVPSGLLKKGNNVITLRVLGRWGVGGFEGPTDRMNLASADSSTLIYLADDWKYNQKIEPETTPWVEYTGYPSFIYNAKIAPIIPFGLKGILWYQGENNTKKPEGYAEYFSLLVNDWRIRFGQGYLTFIYGQLSNFNFRLNQPVESKIAQLRDEQTKGLALYHTAMVCNIDAGKEDGDVHFTNKQLSAKRFADAALGMVYGKDVVYKTQIYKSSKIQGKYIHILFNNVENRLMTNDGKNPISFAIAGSDGKFVWANAKISENEIIVWNDDVPTPKQVRYAWADNPEVNLYTTEGQPVSPFNTQILTTK